LASATTKNPGTQGAQPFSGGDLTPSIGFNRFLPVKNLSSPQSPRQRQRICAEIVLCVKDSQSQHDVAAAVDGYVVERLDMTKIPTVCLQDMGNVRVRPDDQGIPTHKICRVPAKRNVPRIWAQADDWQDITNLHVYLADLETVRRHREQSLFVK
jgi:hypothetical protein